MLVSFFWWNKESHKPYDLNNCQQLLAAVENSNGVRRSTYKQ